MTWEDVASLALKWFKDRCHTVDHPVLTTLSALMR